ncbi:helix-turn-helix domain-containing protein [Photobacterium sp. MCCC 1A19761]|uniref:GlxA family transcriptional regulator n=1 Tax=Photobacterium sp. MCCC 1A19761 TaxID=3115000 RepID=UPI00307E2772
MIISDGKLPKVQSRPKVAVIAFNQFSPFHLSVPCIIFGEGLLRQPLFDLSIVAGEPGAITSDIGMAMTNLAPIDTLDHADIIVIPYWRSLTEKPNPALLAKLAACYQRGATLIGLCLGAYVLAHAGLLAGKKASTHWEVEQDFMQRFPAVQLDTNSLYVECDRLITSAGTAAGLDCCLHVFRQYYGSALANKVARRMVIPPHRDGGQAQYIERPIPEKTADIRINELLNRMRHDLSQPYSLDALAESVLMTRRTFTRKFSKATGMSVGEWLTAERLHVGQELLESTDLSIERIADQVGFSSVIAFREKFKQRFAVTPKEWRRTFQAKSA